MQSGAMTKTALLAVAAGLALLLALNSAAAPAWRPEGVWLTEDQEGAIEIFDCGTRLCGRIVWQLSPLRSDGNPDVDDQNPDPAKRQEPICGLQIIGDLAQVGPTKWQDGWVYDPDGGKTYRATLTMEGSDALRLRGYIGIPLIGGSQLWRPAPPDLPLCRRAG
jgi:uncharacterized protein (DUF2147 family)